MKYPYCDQDILKSVNYKELSLKTEISISNLKATRNNLAAGMTCKCGGLIKDGICELCQEDYRRKPFEKGDIVIFRGKFDSVYVIFEILKYIPKVGWLVEIIDRNSKKIQTLDINLEKFELEQHSHLFAIEKYFQDQ